MRTVWQSDLYKRPNKVLDGSFNGTCSRIVSCIRQGPRTANDYLLVRSRGGVSPRRRWFFLGLKILLGSTAMISNGLHLRGLPSGRGSLSSHSPLSCSHIIFSVKQKASL